MRKFYNILLIILVIAAIVVGAMIVYKYYNEAKNEKELSSFVDETENNLKSQDIDVRNKNIYKGYKVVGIIEIPKIKIKYPILEKTTVQSMLVSVTKFWGPDINEFGNVTIVGHNNFSGTMFGKTKNLENGDIIKLTDLKNNTIEYEVFNKYSIDPNDVSCIKSVEPKTREVTLITCTKGHKERLVVKAREKNNNLK